MGYDAEGIAVFIEQYEGKAMDISWELLGKSRELADKSKDKLIAYCLGMNVKEMAQEAIYRGADVAYYCNDDKLEYYKWETYTKVLYDMVQKSEPNGLIIGATPNGRDVAGRLAVKLHTGLTADVVALDMDKKNILGQVPGFGGAVFAVITCPVARPQMATVRPGIFEAIEPDTKRKGKLKEFESRLTDADVSTEIIKMQKVEGVDISKAKRLVAGGRGLGGDISDLLKLKELLKAEVGVTRPLCDQGLLPRDHQVGSTGVTCKPDITINFGISGAAHYTAGIKDSNTVISINTDPEALIFEYSDYEVVGDAQAILPLLVEKLKAKLVKEVKQ
ncbi:MAG: electron transfer flavoprotein subunit alpha/FixB family protein [Candidatus Heimdallarchaeota archaeon]|nr:electron transfer flavoprotein subunit alpha/FixB family protein [Candidatus Heimdallarchaeota archaeon]